MNCAHCKKKVIIEITCSCKNVYCMKHRMPEDHKCTFDFKEKSRTILSNQMPTISSEKLQNKI